MSRRLLWLIGGVFRLFHSFESTANKRLGSFVFFLSGRERAATWLVRAGRAVGDGGSWVGFGSFWVFDEVEKNQEDMKRITLANAYGAAFPVQMGIERQMLSRFQRPPGPIPSSMLGLEALTGSLEDFGFEDYLNDL